MPGVRRCIFWHHSCEYTGPSLRCDVETKYDMIQYICLKHKSHCNMLRKEARLNKIMASQERSVSFDASFAVPSLAACLATHKAYFPHLE